MNDSKAHYVRLVAERDTLISQIRQCDDCTDAVLELVARSESKLYLYLLTVEDVLLAIDRIRGDLHTELLQVRLGIARMSDKQPYNSK
jgi:hypothetical protein